MKIQNSVAGCIQQNTFTVKSPPVCVCNTESQPALNILHQVSAFREKLNIVASYSCNRRIRLQIDWIDDSHGLFKKIFWTEILHPVGVSPECVCSRWDRNRNNQRTIGFTGFKGNFLLQNRSVVFIQYFYIPYFAD